ncbi:hypothetical protein B0H14DRAFT_2586343 [Mycena olivaceomarginata]|nr:hypothetical protein B0H14DRAFT_2586343 [Mycena olivaceomarginata]
MGLLHCAASYCGSLSAYSIPACAGCVAAAPSNLSFAARSECSQAPVDPSALSRPSPMSSYDTSPSPSSSEPPLPPKLYSKPMDPAWAQRYNKNTKRRRCGSGKRRNDREQDLLLKHQIRICFWGTDGVDPEMFRQQGVRPWPRAL